MQIKRLESELENAKANVSLYRDLADQTKKELVDTEKQLTDLKVEHRVALNEVKSAQEQIKKLEVSVYDILLDWKFCRYILFQLYYVLL